MNDNAEFGEVILQNIEESPFLFFNQQSRL